MRKSTFSATIALLIALALPCFHFNAIAFADTAPQQEKTDPSSTATSAFDPDTVTEFQHSKTTEGEHFNFTVSWNDPVAGQPFTLHCVGSSGTAKYKYYLRSPKYTDPALGWDYVVDPSQTHYTTEADSYDFEFTPMATGTYELQIECMNMDGSGYSPISVKIAISIDDPAYPSVSTRVQNAVKQCNRETDGSDYQKALWLHDWLIDQLDYDNTFLYSSAEAALCRGTGTCQAYMAAYQHLLNAAGIENREVRDEGDYHTWTAVKIDGEWCQVDCTWDDTEYSWQSIDMKHFYFGLTDELMATAHPNFPDVYEAEGYETPSKSLKNGYYVRSGEAATWADAYVERIQSHLNNNEPEFSIAADNASWPDSYKGIYNGYVAYELNHRSWSNDDGPVSLKAAVQGDSFVCTATYQSEAQKPGWHNVDGRWEYRNLSGTRLVNRWLSDKGSWFYFGNDGFALTGKHMVNNTTYFFKPDCRMAIGWIRDSEGYWYYAESSGALVKGWKKLGNTWYFLNPTTHRMTTGWARDGQTWYWFESSGAMRKQSWLLDNGTWYYLGASGAMKTGWLSLGGFWYWLDGSGAMATGWRHIGSSWYYLQPSTGKMLTGWLKVDDSWYYLSSSGAMVTGWQKINDTWYYFSSSGAMT